MSALEIVQYEYGSDNYGQILHDIKTGATAAVDVGDGPGLLAVLAKKGWKLNQLWITHHHGDHVAGLAEVKSATGCKVFGPSKTAGQIGNIDVTLADGDTFEFAGREVAILHTPGHTLDMINFHVASESIVFTGDTLFALGCGRVFEGDAEMMWASLSKLMQLPATTRIYCGHEYTLSNARFSLSVDPGNATLKARAAETEKLREQNKPTVPSLLSEELATNPFLRPSDQGIRQHLGMESASDAEVFAEIRKRKDNF